jgi:hypothetical protein
MKLYSGESKKKAHLQLSFLISLGFTVTFKIAITFATYCSISLD